MLTIRPYTPSHKPQLIELIRLNTPPYFHPSEEILFSNYLDNEREDYFVLEENEKILGCGGLNYEDDFSSAILSWGMIHPDFHGKGLGTKLTKHRLEFVKTKPALLKCIVRTSQHTDKFYSKMGFSLKEVKKEYWGPDLDLYYMEMEL